MTRNDDGNYTHRGWVIVLEQQDVNGCRIRKGLWLCFAPGAESVTFHTSTLEQAASRNDAGMKEGKSNEQ